jgi:predicted ATPase
VLRHLSAENREELIEMLGHAVPGVEAVKTVSHGNKLTLEFTQRTPRGRNRFEAHQMSDGTLRLLGILLALYQPKISPFVAIEEPEATVHVAALEAMVEVFRLRAQHVQLLITTHSADILDFVDVEDLRLVRAEDGHSKIATVSEHSKEAVREALFTPGELLRTGALRASDQDVTAST